jgi:hypothetical protein
MPTLIIGDNERLSEDTDYALVGTSLVVRIDRASRANLVGGGHAWGARVTVTDGRERIELDLVGPDQGGKTWHGYGFELLFVTPTSLRVTSASRQH